MKLGNTELPCEPSDVQMIAEKLGDETSEWCDVTFTNRVLRSTFRVPVKGKANALYEEWRIQLESGVKA